MIEKARAVAYKSLLREESLFQLVIHVSLWKEGKTREVKEVTSTSDEAFDCQQEIVFNPNVFTAFKLTGNPMQIAAGEDNVKEVNLYLTDVVLPKFLQDLCTLEVSPIDSQTLTEVFHAYGINSCYANKKDENVAASGSSILLLFSQQFLQGADHNQMQKVPKRFTTYLSGKGLQLLVEGLGSTP